MKIAMLGGSFNPVHIGHLILAGEVRRTLGYDKIMFVPAYIPPHKQPLTDVPANERCDMVRAAVRGNRHFTVSDFELRKKDISYTFETIKYLYASVAGVSGRIGLILGDDLIAGLPRWRNIDKLAELVDFIVATRDETEAGAKAAMQFPASFCRMPKIDISSTMIRERLMQGDDCRYLLPDGVYRFIKQKKLYKK
ncbi:MAG: nicotinate (nicotinamide) nucleotide adenylyltransferase [Spirochaetes bacterium]|nr:nicotinate (nicotinamide) nucleotide adenylyltransferase [Spirochaetota bacterium]